MERIPTFGVAAHSCATASPTDAPLDGHLILTGPDLPDGLSAVLALIDVPDESLERAKSRLTTLCVGRGTRTSPVTVATEEHVLSLLAQMHCELQGTGAVGLALCSRHQIVVGVLGGASIHLSRSAEGLPLVVPVLAPDDLESHASSIDRDSIEQMVIAGPALTAGVTPYELERSLNGGLALSDVAAWLATLAVGRTGQSCQAIVIRVDRPHEVFSHAKGLYTAVKRVLPGSSGVTRVLALSPRINRVPHLDPSGVWGRLTVARRRVIHVMGRVQQREKRVRQTTKERRQLSAPPAASLPAKAATRLLPDYYALLGVRPDASTEQIQSKYREYVASLQRVTLLGDARQRASAQRQRGQLDAAVEVLRTPSKREQYDRWYAQNYPESLALMRKRSQRR